MDSNFWRGVRVFGSSLALEEFVVQFLSMDWEEILWSSPWSSSCLPWLKFEIFGVVGLVPTVLVAWESLPSPPQFSLLSGSSSSIPRPAGLYTPSRFLGSLPCRPAFDPWPPAASPYMLCPLPGLIRHPHVCTACCILPCSPGWNPCWGRFLPPVASQVAPPSPGPVTPCTTPLFIPAREPWPPLRT
eukprot:Gb_29111 [translate_table: standard]